jgi:hypothetical protein
MSHQPQNLHEFGPFRLDAGERLLQRDGESVSLTPKSFDMLLALVEQHGHLLEKDELMKKVWPDTFVKETNLSSNMSLIRKALKCGENGSQVLFCFCDRDSAFEGGQEREASEKRRCLPKTKKILSCRRSRPRGQRIAQRHDGRRSGLDRSDQRFSYSTGKRRRAGIEYSAARLRFVSFL